ncbi:MAG: HAD family hydrolase [Planctomycetales bacterium]|nr:HAD family hydrolase [Planctomycetales bacterium]
MHLILDSHSVVVFDLDDTLYKEVDYVKSAYRYIASSIREECGECYFELLWNAYHNGEDAFGLLSKQPNVNRSISDLVEMYRFHMPTIELEKGASQLMTDLMYHGVNLGLITDGRHKTQVNKLRALGIFDYFSLIVVSESFGSEKPSPANYLAFQSQFPAGNYTYVGDNLKKDFVTPNSLEWTTICIRDDGRNIHKQDWSLPDKYLPKYCVESIPDIVVSMKTN